jgi:hypothetical protein
VVDGLANRTGAGQESGEEKLWFRMKFTQRHEDVVPCGEAAF